MWLGIKKKKTPPLLDTQKKMSKSYDNCSTSEQVSTHKDPMSTSLSNHNKRNKKISLQITDLENAEFIKLHPNKLRNNYFNLTVNTKNDLY